MPGGRPQFEITDDVLKKAEALASQGLTKKEIARVLGICYQTLNEKTKEFSEFSEAIKNGRAKGVATISNALFNNAKGGNHIAQIFYLKNRSPKRWKDRRHHEHSGKDGGPIKMITTDMSPQEAAEAYADTLKGDGKS